jgi:hypothetical protein
MNKRIVSTIIVLIAISAFPYWIYIPLLFLAIILFPFYWEGIIMAFLIDVLYGGYSHAGISFVYPFAIFASVLVLLALPIRDRIRIHA